MHKQANKSEIFIIKEDKKSRKLVEQQAQELEEERTRLKAMETEKKRLEEKTKKLTKQTKNEPVALGENFEREVTGVDELVRGAAALM